MKKYKFVLAIALVCTASMLAAQQSRHPSPNIEFAVKNLCLGDSTEFINQTLIGGDYIWTITDSVGDTIYTSTDVDVKFLFPSEGIYSVELLANNGHIMTLSKDVVVGTELSADYTWQTCAVNGIKFIANAGCATDYFWYFPGGFTSDSMIVEFRFDTLGTFPVELVVSNGVDTVSIVKQVEVTSLGIPTAEYTYTQNRSTVWFTPMDKDGIFFSWDYNDGVVQDTTLPVTLKHIFDPDDGKNLYNVLLFVQNKCGMGNSTQTIDTRLITGMHAANKDMSVSVYPNPTHGEFTIRLPKQGTYVLEMYALSGQKVYYQALNGGMSFPIQHGLPKGAYLLRISGGKLTYSQLILVR